MASQWNVDSHCRTRERTFFSFLRCQTRCREGKGIEFRLFLFPFFSPSDREENIRRKRKRIVCR